MMKRWKSVIALALAAVMLFSMAACGKDDGKSNEGVSVNGYGRYVEVDITPEGMKVAPHVFYAGENGVYDFYGWEYFNEGDIWWEKPTRYRSTDYGASWTEVDMSWADGYIQKRDWNIERTGMVEELGYNMVLLQDGSLFAYVSTYNYDVYENLGTRFIKVDLDGNETPVEFDGLNLQNEGDIERYFSGMYYLGGDKMYMEYREYDNSSYESRGIGAVYSVSTGQRGPEISLDESNLSLYNEQVLMLENWSDGSYAFYSTEDGSQLENIQMPTYYDMSAEGYYIYSGQALLNQDLDIVAASRNGVKVFHSDGQEPELLLKGLNYSFGSPLKYYNGLLQDGDGNYLMSLSDRDGAYFLVRFEWDPDAIATSDKSLRVFSLYNNQTVQLALSQYKLEHPEVEVDYEYALERYYYGEETEILSVEDVLRNLNNELLTGNGPDVLILDEMPVQSYIDKGILADISAAVEGADMYTNMLEPFKTGGKLYALPTRFYVPLLFTRDTDSTDYTGLDALVSAIVNGGEIPEDVYIDWDTISEEEEIAYYQRMNQTTPFDELPTMYFNSLSELVSVFYEISAPAIYTDNSGLDRDALATYLEAVKQVADKYGLKTMQERDNEINALYGYDLAVASGDYYDEYINNGGTVGTYTSSYSYFARQESRTGFMQLSTFTDLMTFAWQRMYSDEPMIYYTMQGNEVEIVPEKKEDMTVDIQLATGMASELYVPSVIAGVVSTSKNVDVATDFLASMLNVNVQGYDMYDGLPVTAEGNKKQYASYMDGTDYGRYYDDVEFQLVEFAYDGYFSQLNTPYTRNTYLLEIIYNYAVNYCRGEMSLEQAVQQIASETEMYFAERQ